MAQTRRDVKLVYDDPPDQIAVTPQGSSLSGTIGSGFPFFQGVDVPPNDLSWDLSQGPFLQPMDLNIGGTGGPTATLPTLRQSYVANGGRFGTGAVRRDWFNGMPDGSSPLWVNEFVFPASRHFVVKYFVKQNAPMDSDGSNVKLCRFYNGISTLRKLGSLLSVGGPAGHANYHDFNWFWEGWKPGRAGRISNFALPTDDIWHEWSLECIFGPSQLYFGFELDGVPIFNSNTTSEVGDYVVPGAPLFFSPFVETYSGNGASVNTGRFDVDDITYTVLP